MQTESTVPQRYSALVFLCLLLGLSSILDCATRMVGDEALNVTTEKTEEQVMTEEPKPRIEIQETTIDFGELSMHKTVNREIEIHNTGTADLVIENIQPDCYCTYITYFDNIIKPGESGVVEFTFTAQPPVGYSEKTLPIVSNDPDQPRIDIILKSVVKEWYRIFPPNPNTAVFLEVFEGEPTSKDIIIRCLDGSGCRAEYILKTKPFILAEVMPISTPGCLLSVGDEIFETKPNDQILKIMISPYLSQGNYKGLLRIGFDRTGDKTIDMQLRISVKPRVQVSKTAFRFGRISSKTPLPVVQELEVFHVRDLPFSIVDVTAQITGVTIEFDRERKSNHVLNIAYNGGLKPGKYVDSLIITVADSDEFIIQSIYNIEIVD